MQMKKIILFLNIPMIEGGIRYLLILASSILPAKLCFKKNLSFLCEPCSKRRKQHPRKFQRFIFCLFFTRARLQKFLTIMKGLCPTHKKEVRYSVDVFLNLQDQCSLLNCRTWLERHSRI